MRAQKLFLALLFYTIAGNSLAEGKPDLEMTIKSDKKAYKLTETILVTAVFKNNSKVQQVLFWDAATQAALVPVNDNTMQLIVPVPTGQNVSAPETFMVGHDSVFEKSLPMPASNFAGEGEYNLTYTYQPPSTNLDFKVANGQKLWLDKLTSNTITIQISK